MHRGRRIYYRLHLHTRTRHTHHTQGYDVCEGTGIITASTAVAPRGNHANNATTTEHAAVRDGGAGGEHRGAQPRGTPVWAQPVLCKHSTTSVPMVRQRNIHTQHTQTCTHRERQR